MDSDGGDRAGHTPLHNRLHGNVHGHVVQAGSIGHVSYHDGGIDYPVPAQLPPPPHVFTSRTDELSELDGWLDENQGQPLLSVISGPAGVGKTTLAVRWLRDVRERFPDGQLYANLGAFSGGPVDPEEALGRFLIDLGVSPRRIPEQLPQRETLYRSLTTDRSIAVLLDDALSAAQVRPLLPASVRSVVVVTSRWRLSGLRTVGARFVEVDPLNVSDSVELLHKVVGGSRTESERTEAEELARLCGGMPLALSVVGARLSARPHRSLAREVGDLREKDRFAVLSLDDELSVGLIFDMSYETLPPEQARFYRFSALHPGPVFGVDVVAAMVDQSVDDAEPMLDSLVERNLLSEIDDRRFRYHDLLRLHARQQADRVDDEPTRTAAVGRMVEWYLDTAFAADQVLRPTRKRVAKRSVRPTDRSHLFRSHRETLRWLERERGNLVQAIRTAREREWHDLVWQLCEALWGFMPYARSYRDWEDIYRSGALAARRSGNRLAEARLRTLLGSTLTSMGSYDDAIQESLVGLRLSEEIADDDAKAAALAELASASRGKGDLAAALGYLSRARAVRERSGTVRSLSQSIRQIGEVLSELGRFEEAVTELLQAARLVPRADIEEARVLTSLGIAYLRWSRTDDARAPLRRALAVAQELDSAQYQANALAALGELAERTADHPAARDYLSRAIALYTEGGDPRADELAARLARLSASNT
jgi:tetratricopeptide (TPR) repeat protein